MKQLRSHLEAALTQAIAQGIFSGAQFIAGRGRQRRIEVCYGKTSANLSAPEVDANTLFDLASLTKPLCTAALFMHGHARQPAILDEPLHHLLPEFTRQDPIRLRHLLDHTSGLPAWLSLYQEAQAKKLSRSQVEALYLRQIDRVPLETEVGTKRIYSDLGFILLGFLLERLEHSRLDLLFERQIASPLGMTRTFFTPLRHQVERKRIAATEQCPWRLRLLQGEVHDDNAWMLGGVAGHAGLFGTARDIETFVFELFAAREGRGKLWTQKTFETFLGPAVFLKRGWDTVSQPHSQAGRYFSPASFGHLGFTGCSLWIDPDDEKYAILLTNRVHPSRQNEAIKIFRPQIHDLVFAPEGV